MPSKQKKARKRKKKWYAENYSKIKRRRIEKGITKTTKKVFSSKDWYEKHAKGHKTKARERYILNLESERRRRRLKYNADPDAQKDRMRKHYNADPELQRTQKRKRYYKNPEHYKLKRRMRYKVTRTVNPGYFRLQYKRKTFHERVRKCSEYQNNRFIAKKIKKHRTATITKQKMKKNNVFLGRLNTEKISRLVAKRISGGGYATRLLRAKELLKWALHSHTSNLNQFKKHIIGLKNRLKKSLSNFCSTDTFENKVEALCGRSLHTSNSEPFFWEFTYRLFSGKPISVGHEPSTAHIFPSQKSALTPQTWKCNSDICLIELSHLEKLKSFMEEIVNSSFTSASNIILNMGEHSCKTHKLSRKCGQLHSLECYDYKYKCISKLPFLRTISPHFPKIRNIVLQIYKLLRIARKMIVIKDAINNQQVNVLISIEKEFKMQAKAFLQEQCKNKTPLSEAELLRKYHKAFVLLEKRSCDTPVYPCVSCDKLLCKRQVSLLTNLKRQVSGNIWDELQILKQDECKSGYICHGCVDKIRKYEMPPSCILNGLHVGIQPKELSCLNSFEKILIQRAKAFQVITKMNTVGKKRCAAEQQISKVVGRSFHLPLPLQETLNKLPQPSEALNPNLELYILVRGVPTKSKHIWQMLVSVHRVHAALRFLKENNLHYCEITLPDQPEELFDLTNNTYVLQTSSTNEAPAKELLQRRAILTQVTHEEWDSDGAHYTIHALHEPKSYSDDTSLYKMLKVSEPPIGSENKIIDVLCFPDLYPTGKFGQFHSRETKLTSAEFIKCRLLSKHSQFRLNHQYLFYLLHDANLRQLKQGIFHKLNVTGVKGPLSAKECLNNIASGELEGNLTSVFSKLRNTSQYWIQPRNDVNCMAQHYGPATWFLTMSPSDWNWDDMALFIKEVNCKVPGIDSKKTSELVAMDPVSASRFIQNKFTAMLEFLLSDDAPLGKVIHYFYRREYQSRGLQHFHLLLWVKDAPIMGKANNAEVADFILKYVTCNVPNEITCPTLYCRVTSYQTHHHNSYCLRTKKTKTGFYKVCRFGFPRPITESLVLRDVIESVAGRKALKAKSRLYDLPRMPRESYINDYNPAVLLAWNGNIDIQYVGESTSILHWYVTKYTTKSEQSHVGQVFSEINSTKSLASRLFNVGLRALNNRECGALEASDTLLGIPLYGTDPDTTIRWLDVGMVRKKRLHKIDKIRSMDPNSVDIFYESWVDDHYPKRPASLENINLYDFVRWYDISAQPPKSNREVHKLMSGKYLIKRIRPCLLNHYKYSPVQDPEKYYFALLLMFLCWRSTVQLKESFATYEESFMAKKHLLQQAIDYDSRLKEIAETTDKARDNIKNRVEELEAEKATADDNFKEVYQIPVETVPLVHPMSDTHTLPNKDLFVETCHKLNSDQERVFEYVKRVLLNSDGTDKVLRHFVSGVGGTGKSFLIKTISHWTKQCLQESTSISAPTGLSAYNINGSTIYRVFQLPVEHGRTPKYRALTDDVLKVLRADLKHVVLFIIDEVSMVSNLTLMYINLRLCEIFNTADQNNGWFGKKHLLLFGDLLQLPPVHEDSPFVELDNSKLNSLVGSLSCENIWYEHFSYDELTINMRQAQDCLFADVLSRVRVGNMTNTDIKLIENRKIHLPGKSALENLSILGDYLTSLPADTVCVCSTGNQCIKVNNEMLNRIKGPIVNLVAIDSVDCLPRQKCKINKILSSYDSDCSRTAGMEKVIPVKIGAKVMLRRNIDVNLGLVNSAIGIVKQFKFNLDTPDQVDTISIHFDSGLIHDLHRVRVKFQVLDKAFVYREQFPITMSYAITIHKCQGLSLRSAVIDIGESVFTCGQSYVALSRVTTLEGLHVINFNPRDVKAQKSALSEYNRLRQMYMPHLPLYNTSYDQTSIPYVRDRKWCQSKNVEEVQDKITESVPPVRNKRKHQTKRKAHTNTTTRGFQNSDNVSCYANAVVQMLYSTPFITEVVKHSHQICLDFKKHLDDYVKMPPHTVLNTLIIRNITANNIYTIREQQDSALFLVDLMATNQGLSEVFSYSTVETRTCQRCNYTVKDQEKLDNIIRVPMPGGKVLLDTLIQLTVNGKWETLEDYLCSNIECKQRGTSLRKVEITRTNRCIVLHFLLFNNQLQKVNTSTISGVPSSQVVIHGKIYKPTAAVFHYGNTIHEGHYTCMKKTGNGWLSTNDEVIEKKRWPVGSKNMYMLLLTEQ